MTSLVHDERPTSLKGRRLPGKPSRFDPDQPLHMTTRRAAKSRTTDGSSSSFNGSVDGDSSRRGSIDAARPTSSDGADSQKSVQDRLFSPAVPDFLITHNDSDSKQSLMGSDDSFRPYPLPQNHELDHTPQSPSRKRKRSLSPPDAGVDESIAARSVIQENLTPGSNQWAETTEAPFSESDLLHPIEGVNVGLRSPTRSLKETPLPSARVSPASTASGSESNLQLKSMAPGDSNGFSQNEVDNIDGGDDLDEGNDAEDQPMSDFDGPITKKRRLGGRRRVAHAIPRVEAAMRRQAELRTAYRTLARLQKVLLVEIATRNIDELKADETFYKRASGYEILLDQLRAKLEQRRTKIQCDHDRTKALLQQELHAEQHVRRAGYLQHAVEMRDTFVHGLEHRILEIERKAHAAGGYSELDTEGEDSEEDVVPMLKTAYYPNGHGGNLDPCYDSRSRVLLETQQQLLKLNARMEMKKALREFEDATSSLTRAPFTVFDSTAREALKDHRRATKNVKTLAKAARHVNRRAKITVLPNDEATGLQALGDAAIQHRLPPRMPPPQPPTMPPSRPPKQYAASIQPSVQSLLSSDEPSVQKSPVIKREGSGSHMSPRMNYFDYYNSRHPTLSTPFQSTPSIDRGSLSNDSSTNHNRFQPLRLPGYQRQFELAPPGEENNRERKSRYSPIGWPALPRASDLLSERSTGRMQEQGAPPRFTLPSNSPRTSSMNLLSDRPPTERSKDEIQSREQHPTNPGVREPFDLRSPWADHTPGQPIRPPGQIALDAQNPINPLIRRPLSLSGPSPIGAPSDTTGSDAGPLVREKISYFNKWKANPTDERAHRARKGAAKDERRETGRRHGHSLSSSSTGTGKTGQIDYSEGASTSHHRRPSLDSAGPPGAPAATTTNTAPARPGHPEPLPLPLGFGTSQALPSLSHSQNKQNYSFRPMNSDYDQSTQHRDSFPPPLSQWALNPPLTDPQRFIVPPPRPNPWTSLPSITPRDIPPPASRDGATPTSATPTGPYGHPYGGPTLAPAYEDPRRHPQGFGAPLPAFAQQQRISEGARRRAQSEAQQPKIHQWTPSGQKRI